jgi:hypothetical protein
MISDRQVEIDKSTARFYPKKKIPSDITYIDYKKYTFLGGNHKLVIGNHFLYQVIKDGYMTYPISTI